MVNIWVVLSHSLTVLCVAFLVLITHKIFKNRLNPKWQSYLWWVVIFIALLPAKFIGTASVVNFKQFTDQIRITIEMLLNSNYSSPWVSEVGQFSFPIIPYVSPNSITDILFLVYIAWVFCSGLWFILSYIYLRFDIYKSVVIKNDRVEEIANTYKLSKPKAIVESRKAKTPFVVGIFNPILVLPINQEFDDCVYIHELLHLKHKDIILGWITTFVRCIYPVLWPFCNVMDNDRERACDQRVLELLQGEQRRTYGYVLLSMIDNKAIHTPGTTAMANGAKCIKKRIASIANFKKYPAGMGLVSLCIVAVFAFAMVGGNITAIAKYETNSLLTNSFEVNAANAMAFGQNNKATTPAGALDLYTQGRYYDIHRKYNNLAYLSAVTKSEEMESLYSEWQNKLGVSHDSLENSYRTGPVIRGISKGNNDDYICEIYFYKDIKDPTYDVMYRKTTVSLQKEGNYWTVSELVEVEKKIKGDDTLHLNDNHSAVVWNADVAGYHIALSQIGQISVNSTLINGNNLEYQKVFPLLNMNHQNPNPNGEFWSYEVVYLVSITNISGDIFDEISLSINFKTENKSYDKNTSYPYPININETQYIDTGTSGVIHINNISWETISPPISISGTIVIDNHNYEVEFEKQVRLP